jgi:hypothetical protein
MQGSSAVEKIELQNKIWWKPNKLSFFLMPPSTSIVSRDDNDPLTQGGVLNRQHLLVGSVLHLTITPGSRRGIDSVDTANYYYVGTRPTIDGDWRRRSPETPPPVTHVHVPERDKGAMQRKKNKN